MALFSRRVLQRMLDSSHPYLSLPERQNFCNLLNKVHDNYLSTEWELAVLDAASHLGTVQHEPDFGGGRRPDFLFHGKSGFSFIADVTAVSDRGLHQQNPFDALQEEFRRQQRRFGLMHGGFSIDVRDWPRRSFRGSGDKPRLKLPKVSEFHTKIFGGRFRAFMESVRQNPNIPQEYGIDSEDTFVKFSYRPERLGFGGGSHPAFDFAAVVDSNPVYNALSSKAEQLRNSGYNGVKGIFLCDGGCRILHDKTGHWAAYPIQEVVLHFLRQHRSVSFVAIFVVAPNPGRLSRISDVHLEANLFINEHAVELRFAVESIVKQIATGLPLPEQSPVNALNHLKGRNGMDGRHLGTLTRGGSIQMSARMLLEILAGKMTVVEFEQEYRMKPEENPFRLMLAQGRLLNSVNLEAHPDKDDDRVTLSFGQADAAVSPFITK